MEWLLSLAGAESPSDPHRLVALGLLISALDDELRTEWLARIEVVPRDKYPLFQLAVARAFDEQWGTQLDSSFRTRLDALVRTQYCEVGLHYVRFAKAFDRALRDRGKPEITDDWSTYEDRFMGEYYSELGKRNAPGWNPDWARSDAPAQQDNVE